MSTAKKFAGQTAVYGLSTIASRILTFFMTPVYTRAYPLAAYGIITTMYSYVSMVNAALTFGMETTFFRYLNKYADDKQRVYNNAFASVLAVTLIFLAFSLPFIGNIANFIDIDHAAKHGHKAVIGTTEADFLKYTYLFFATVVVDAWCAIPFVKLRADGKPGRYGAIKLASVLTFVGFNLAFIYVVPFWVNHNFIGTAWINQWYVKGWVGYVFVSELTSSIVTLLLLLPELLKIRFDLDKKMLLQMYSYSWPILIANISYIINENLDNLLLGKLLPPNANTLRDVGIYGACRKIPIFLSIFINAFRLGAEPFFFSYSKNKNAGETYARIMNYFVITVCVIFVALIGNIEILKYFIKGHDATQNAWTGLSVIPPLVLGYVCLGIYMNLSIWYKLSDQTKFGLYISGIGAIVTIVLNVAFIPKYSYMASAWTSMIAYAVMMVLSYVWGQKYYPIPYNLKKNLSYIVVSIILVYISFSVFHRNIFIGNALFIGFGAAALYLERKELIALLRKK